MLLREDDEAPPPWGRRDRDRDISGDLGEGVAGTCACCTLFVLAIAMALLIVFSRRVAQEHVTVGTVDSAVTSYKFLESNLFLLLPNLKIEGETRHGKCCGTKSCQYTSGTQAQSYCGWFYRDQEIPVWYTPNDPNEVYCDLQAHVPGSWIFALICGSFFGVLLLGLIPATVVIIVYEVPQCWGNRHRHPAPIGAVPAPIELEPVAPMDVEGCEPMVV
ncbi:hypothetical protein Pelo_16922 [Pelomyxa schiedti]|nr:hypothetical protein Pelo_16922 [Pelomyxa schiedti]